MDVQDRPDSTLLVKAHFLFHLMKKHHDLSKSIGEFLFSCYDKMVFKLLEGLKTYFIFLHVLLKIEKL